MRIVFNLVAFIEFAICLLVGIGAEFILSAFGAGEGVRNITYKVGGTLLFVLVMIVGDLFLRYLSVKKSNEKMYKVLFPNRGGHIFFIPTFLFGIYMIYVVVAG